jgi:hypothetical protein
MSATASGRTRRSVLLSLHGYRALRRGMRPKIPP